MGLLYKLLVRYKVCKVPFLALLGCWSSCQGRRLACRVGANMLALTTVFTANICKHTFVCFPFVAKTRCYFVLDKNSALSEWIFGSTSISLHSPSLQGSTHVAGAGGGIQLQLDELSFLAAGALVRFKLGATWQSSKAQNYTKLFDSRSKKLFLEKRDVGDVDESTWGDESRQLDACSGLVFGFCGADGSRRIELKPAKRAYVGWKIPWEMWSRNLPWIGMNPYISGIQGIWY